MSQSKKEVIPRGIIFLRFIYYVYSILSACMPAGQKRAPDLITDGFGSLCGCWELTSGPSEEQAVLLTSESSLQPYSFLFVLFSKFSSSE